MEEDTTDAATLAWLELQRADAAIVARSEQMIDVQQQRQRQLPQATADTVRPPAGSMGVTQFEDPGAVATGHDRRGASIDAIWEALKESDRLLSQRSRASSSGKRDHDTAASQMETDEASTADTPAMCRRGSLGKRRCEKLDLGLLEEAPSPPLSATPETVSPFKRLRL